MADKKQANKQKPEAVSKIDALYSWLSYDLQKMKGELLKELKYSSVQFGSLYQEIKNDREQSSKAIAQEIRYSYKQNQTIYDGLAEMITVKVGQRLDSMDEKCSSIEDIKNTVAEVVTGLNAVDAAVALLPETLSGAVKEDLATIMPQLEEAVNEIKYSFMQHQAIYDGLTTLITGEVVSRLEDVQGKLAILEQLDKVIEEVNQKITEGFTALEESVAEHSRQILEAVSAIPVAENIDYNRIVDEVGDKVLELIGDVVSNEPAMASAEPVEAKIDYDKIVYGTAEKVVESLPYPEKVDYRRIDDNFMKAVENVQVGVSEEVIANAVSLAVEKAMSALNIDAIAEAVAAKITVPTVEVDYDRLSDMVAAKLAASSDQTYDVVLDETGIEQIAEKVTEKIGTVDYDQIAMASMSSAPQPVEVDYDRIAQIVAEKTATEATYELVIDEDGLQAIADNVAQRLCDMCATCEPCEEEPPVEVPVEEPVVEEPVEEVVEEPVVEEPVEEVVEEPVEEVVEEPVVEEPVEEVVEEPVAEEVATDEIAVTAEPEYQEIDNQLVDAETGLVIRLKKSFTAKMKQSDERIKGYYSDIKNELTSYKRVNSNVSWHGDRFNFGRETIAKVNICGKTLCFYLALDPENPDLKQTVYHQKNVGGQKAYENTPFMIKVKSDAAAKKALRLVGILAEKIGAQKDAKFEATDYVEEFAYASTKQLFEDGFIKVTKEKKVDLDF